MIEEIPDHSKRILFEFTGGCMDGKTADSLDPDSLEAAWAQVYFLLAERGRTGTRFRLFSERALECMMQEGLAGLKYRRPSMNHVYEVTGMDEDETTTYVRVCFVGQEPREEKT
jgi:hypothetical protein